MNASATFNSEKTFSNFAGRVATEIIAPNLVWKAGRWACMHAHQRSSQHLSCVYRTAAAIRTAAMTCLQALVQVEGVSVELIDQLIPDLLPKVDA